MAAAALNLVTAATADRLRELLARAPGGGGSAPAWRDAAVDPPPRPLELRVLPGPSGTDLLCIWLGPDMAEAAGAVRVNGVAVQPAEPAFAAYQPPAGLPVPAGWYMPSGIYSAPVWMCFSTRDSGDPAAPAAQTGSLYWDLRSAPSSAPWGPLYAHPVLLGLSDAQGALVQCAVGAVDVTVWLPDSDAAPDTPTAQAPELLSLDQIAATGIAQLHDFAAPQLLAPADIDLGLSAATQAEFVFRVPRSDGRGARVAYGTVRALFEAAANHGLTPGPSDTEVLSDLTAIPCPTDGNGALVVWDPCQPGWIDLSRLPANDPRLARLPYWRSGGDETACYGSGIGDSSQTRVVDLDGCHALGSWTVDSLSVAAGGITIGGDDYAPASVTIGGTPYTILVKI